MNTKHLPILLLALVVAGGLGFLIRDLRGGSSDGGASSASTAPSAPAKGPRIRDHRGARPQVGGQAEAEVDTTLPADQRMMAGGDGPTVSDHRGDEPGEPAEPPPTYKIEPTLIAASRLAVRPLIRRCSEQYASEIGPEGGVVQLVLDSHVEAGRLSLNGVKIQTKEVPDSGDLVECVRRGLEGFSIPAEGNRDVAHHPLTFPFHVPVP